MFVREFRRDWSDLNSRTNTYNLGDPQNRAKVKLPIPNYLRDRLHDRQKKSICVFTKPTQNSSIRDIIFDAIDLPFRFRNHDLRRTSASYGMQAVDNNPIGRPIGYKHRLSQSILQDLAEHWQAKGGDILKRVTDEDPAAVLRVIASLIPKEIIGYLEVGQDETGIVINFTGGSHPLLELDERDITPTEETKSPRGAF